MSNMKVKLDVGLKKYQIDLEQTEMNDGSNRWWEYNAKYNGHQESGTDQTTVLDKMKRYIYIRKMKRI